MLTQGYRRSMSQSPHSRSLLLRDFHLASSISALPHPVLAFCEPPVQNHPSPFADLQLDSSKNMIGEVMVLDPPIESCSDAVGCGLWWRWSPWIYKMYNIIKETCRIRETVHNFLEKEKNGVKICV
ncbi:hypothetical protein L2E82_48878 [Cichorium intybus]|uniref:Uncharacterized protein n=1 Tax=Cichorium intybus TaxID=13427 RepID=A0ACB8YZN9_CICIN|nr:hypothetical protein L2E82_48878 [Cichorium intybus]